MDQMHSLLKRQLKRHFGTPDSIPAQWQGFVEAVNDAYRQSDDDRNMLERSLELSSQELLQANSELRTIFEAFPDLFFRLDHDGTILDYKAGRTAESYMPMEKLLGKRIQDVPFEEVRHKFVEAIHQLRQRKSMVSLEYALKIQGQDSYYEARLLPVLKDQVIVIVRNITEQTLAEEALRESEKRFQQVAENALEWIWEVDARGLYIYASPIVEKILGYKPEEIVGKKHFYDLFHPEDREEFKKAAFEVFAQKQSFRKFVNKNVDKDGKTVWLSTSGVPILDEKGNPLGYRGVDTDITDRKQAEEALQREKERFKVLVEESPFGVSLIAADGHYIYINPKFSEIFGYTLEDVLTGREWFAKAYPDPEYRSEAISTWISDLKESQIGESRPRNYAVNTKDGSERLINFRSVTLVTGEQLVIYEDITERKGLEDQLLQAQKMESIGTLTSGVAHNFRNILAGILANSQLLQLIYKGDPKLLEIEQRTESAVKRGAQLVKDLMRLSRKEREETFQQINLAQVLKETYELIKKSFDKKVDIHLEIPETLPIVGNHSDLSQVFMNLCTNARDAMPEGGKLRIEAKKEGDNFLVTISDTGHGMDEESLENCFNPFFTTKDVDKGTGLGLSTSYGIVKDHGGKIHVFSEVNKGTTFKLYFPLTAEEKEGEREEMPEIILGRGQKVLIVDDEMDILKSIENALERLGYKVASVTSGEKAVLKYQSWRPDIVLLDRNMPAMDGITCARRILEDDPGAKIVLISGYEETGPTGIDDKTKSFIKGYLSKPIDVSYLTGLLGRVIND